MARANIWLILLVGVIIGGLVNSQSLALADPTSPPPTTVEGTLDSNGTFTPTATITPTAQTLSKTQIREYQIPCSKTEEGLNNLKSGHFITAAWDLSLGLSNFVTGYEQFCWTIRLLSSGMGLLACTLINDLIDPIFNTTSEKNATCDANNPKVIPASSATDASPSPGTNSNQTAADTPIETPTPTSTRITPEPGTTTTLKGGATRVN